MNRRILVTGEGPWTSVSGGKPGNYRGAHISEVRPLCIAEALQKAGNDVSFLSKAGSGDNAGGFSFRCIGLEGICPDDYDVVVCHQAMLWRHEGFEILRQHPNILVAGDLFPEKEFPQNIRWIFYDAPDHAEKPRLVKKWPDAYIAEGCFGVAEYDHIIPDPFPNHDKPNIVYLGKIYERANIEVLNALAESDEINLWFGGRVAGKILGQTFDPNMTTEERTELFSNKVHFVTDTVISDIHLPIMEAARFCQHADFGLLLDPECRTATVSKMYFYMGCGTPTLVIGGCSNMNHVIEATAGSIVAPASWKHQTEDMRKDLIGKILKTLRVRTRMPPDRQGIKRRAFDKWSYDKIVQPWIACWEKDGL